MGIDGIKIRIKDLSQVALFLVMGDSKGSFFNAVLEVEN